MMTATWRGMRERSSCLSSSDSSTLKGPRVFGAPTGDGESCLVCGTATVARLFGNFPLPRKVNIRIVGMQTMCRESIGIVSHDDYATIKDQAASAHRRTGRDGVLRGNKTPHANSACGVIQSGNRYLQDKITSRRDTARGRRSRVEGYTRDTNQGDLHHRIRRRRRCP